MTPHDVSGSVSFLNPHEEKQAVAMEKVETNVINSVYTKHLSYIAPETAICRNPPIHNFTGDKKNLTDP
jgi:hypothetical protein